MARTLNTKFDIEVAENLASGLVTAARIMRTRANTKKPIRFPRLIQKKIVLLF